MKHSSHRLVDMRVAELLASRLCHDLVGPIGAVNNGLEFLQDDDFGSADDALSLVSKSAAQTADLVQLYRLAYGLAGEILEPEAWKGRTEQALQRARALPDRALKDMLELTGTDSRDEDMAAIVATAARPGLKDRVVAYRDKVLAKGAAAKT